VARFIDGDHFGREAFGQRDGVVDVIEVAVGDADGIDALNLVALGVRRVAVDPRVHHDDLTRRKTELKSAMTKPGDLHASRLAQTAPRQN